MGLTEAGAAYKFAALVTKLMNDRGVPYTLGPWSICKDSPNLVCSSAGDIPVARVDLRWGAVAAANAHLIAAAPELVEVLTEILDRFGNIIEPTVARRARTVLATARGEVRY
jgi:hypothetical protein